MPERDDPPADVPAAAPPPAEEFGDLLRRWRVERGLSQEELAAAAKVHARTVQDLERGRSRSAQPANARRLADALRLDFRDRDDFLLAAGAARGAGRRDGRTLVPSTDSTETAAPTGTAARTASTDQPAAAEEVLLVPTPEARFRASRLALVGVATALAAILGGWVLSQGGGSLEGARGGEPDPGTETPTTDLHPVQDTFLQSDTEQGVDREVLKVGTHPDGAPTYRALLQFDLSSAPADGLRQAKLRLWTVDSSTCEASRIDAYPVTSDWTETDVTWSRQPDVSEAPEYAASESFAFGHEPDCPNSNAYIDITEMTRAWLEGRLPNRGLTLRADETDPNTMKHFCSSEVGPEDVRSTCTDTRRFPTLLLEY